MILIDKYILPFSFYLIDRQMHIVFFSFYLIDRFFRFNVYQHEPFLSSLIILTFSHCVMYPLSLFHQAYSLASQIKSLYVDVSGTSIFFCNHHLYRFIKKQQKFTRLSLYVACQQFFSS